MTPSSIPSSNDLQRDRFYFLEDILEVIPDVCNSFNLSFETDDFSNARTFGDICDTILSKINLPHENGCTTQQAFYKIKNAIMNVTYMDARHIRCNTHLSEIFQEQDQPETIAAFRKELGLPYKISLFVDKLLTKAPVIMISSMFTLPFYPEAGLIGIISSIYLYSATAHFNIDKYTVGELARQLTGEHYPLVRRNSKTINRTEITGLIRKGFSHYYQVEEIDISKDTILHHR